jgi:hypothetical protein
MEHLDEGALQALLDGELEEGTTQAAQDHLAACDSCNAAFAAVRDASHELSTALAMLDRKAGLLRPPLVPPTARSSRWRWGGVAVPKAAALLIAFGAVASATVPGSPVRAWLGERLEAPSPPVAVHERTPAAAGTEATLAATPESGVSVEPVDGQLRILLTRPDPDLLVRARITESPRGGAYGIGDAAAARFSTAAGTVEVIDAPGGELRVEIPRLVRSAAVIVDGRLYLLKEGDRLRLTGAPAAEAAAEVVFPIRQ